MISGGCATFQPVSAQGTTPATTPGSTTRKSRLPAAALRRGSRTRRLPSTAHGFSSSQAASCANSPILRRTVGTPPVSPETSAPACSLRRALCVTQMVVRAHDQALPQAFLQIRCQCRNLNRAPLCRHSDIAILAPMTLLRQTYLHQIVTRLRAHELPADVAVDAPS